MTLVASATRSASNFGSARKMMVPLLNRTQLVFGLLATSLHTATYCCCKSVSDVCSVVIVSNLKENENEREGVELQLILGGLFLENRSLKWFSFLSGPTRKKNLLTANAPFFREAQVRWVGSEPKVERGFLCALGQQDGRLARPRYDLCALVISTRPGRRERKPRTSAALRCMSSIPRSPCARRSPTYCVPTRSGYSTSTSTSNFHNCIMA